METRREQRRRTLEQLIESTFIGDGSRPMSDVFDFVEQEVAAAYDRGRRDASSQEQES